MGMRVAVTVTLSMASERDWAEAVPRDSPASRQVTQKKAGIFISQIKVTKKEAFLPEMNSSF